ncbi:AmmeMemoRadiSam system protein B [Patescibacteria group bacterium]
MRKKTSVFSFIVFLGLITIFFLTLSTKWTKPVKTNQELEESLTQNYHEVKPAETALIQAGISQADKVDNSFGHKVAGGIVPHHLLASNLIANFFKRLSFQKVSTLIILAPNHFEKGSFNALTSLYHWKTTFGSIAPSRLLTQTLVDDGLIKTNEAVLSNEHAISDLLPFVAHYLPETKVLPIIFRRQASLEEIEILALKITEITDEKTVILASVDFSHYLKPKAANQNDAEILKIIKDFDYSKLLGLDNDFLDSPAAISLLLMAMNNLGKTNQELHSHTNSAEIVGDPFAENTSYLLMTLY